MNTYTHANPRIPADKYTFEEAHGRYRTRGGRSLYITLCPDGSVETKEYNKRYFKSYDEFRKWLQEAS